MCLFNKKSLVATSSYHERVSFFDIPHGQTINPAGSLGQEEAHSRWMRIDSATVRCFAINRAETITHISWSIGANDTLCGCPISGAPVQWAPGHCLGSDVVDGWFTCASSKDQTYWNVIVVANKMGCISGVVGAAGEYRFGQECEASVWGPWDQNHVQQTRDDRRMQRRMDGWVNVRTE